MSLQDRQREFCTYLQAGFTGQVNLAGWSLRGAIAGAANATQENLVQPVTLGPKDHGSDGALQWRLDRLTNMQAWCTRYFGDWRNLKAQAAFTLYETAERDRQRGTTLDADLRAGAKSLATLTTNFNRQFEVSADDEAINAKRIKYATEIEAFMKTASPPVSAGKAAAGGVLTTGGIIGAATGAVMMNHVITPEDVVIGASMALNFLSAFVIWQLWSHARGVPAPPPIPAIIPAVTDLLKAAVERRAQTAADLASADKEVGVQRDALTKFIADIEDQLKQVETKT